MYRVNWTRPQAPHPSPGRPARGLRSGALRALALCFTAALPLQALAQCITPDSVPSRLVQPGARWSDLQAWMTQHGVGFVPGDTAEWVIPCPKRKAGQCAPMRARVNAVQNALCLTHALVSGGGTYFVGTVRRFAGWDPANLGFGQPNPTDSIFLLVQGERSIGLFHDSNGNVRTIPQSSTGWRFRFHVEDTTPAQPWARWRKDVSDVEGLVAMHREPHVRGGPSAFLPDDGDGAQLGDPVFAWISCAAGCCQFHGAPGGGGDPTPEPDPRPRPFPGNQPNNPPGNRPERE